MDGAFVMQGCWEKLFALAVLSCAKMELELFTLDAFFVRKSSLGVLFQDCFCREAEWYAACVECNKLFNGLLHSRELTIDLSCWLYT